MNEITGERTLGSYEFIDLLPRIDSIESNTLGVIASPDRSFNVEDRHQDTNYIAGGTRKSTCVPAEKVADDAKDRPHGYRMGDRDVG